MKLQDFEKALVRMTIPQDVHLKHKDLLAHSFEVVKSKSVVSWWWLLIPFYLLGCFYMKSLYFENTSWKGLLAGWSSENPLSFTLLFLALPSLILLLNIISLRKLYFLVAKPPIASFISSVKSNLGMMVLSLILLLIYLL